METTSPLDRKSTIIQKYILRLKDIERQLENAQSEEEVEDIFENAHKIKFHYLHTFTLRCMFIYFIYQFPSQTFWFGIALHEEAREETLLMRAWNVLFWNYLLLPIYGVLLRVYAYFIGYKSHYSFGKRFESSYDQNKTITLIFIMKALDMLPWTPASFYSICAGPAVIYTYSFILYAAFSSLKKKND